MTFIPARELGDGVAMPVLGLGVWQMSDGPRDGAGRRVGARGRLPAHRHGADVPQRGERRCGARAQPRPARGGLRDDEVGSDGARRRRELEHSLERLGIGYVDLYLIHWPVPGARGAAWRDLEQAKERGLARSIGVSNYGSDRMEKLGRRVGGRR